MYSTVIVMGAGASKEYGLPIGAELTQMILSSRAQLIDHLARRSTAGFASGLVDDLEKDMIGRRVDGFLNTFRSAATETIDRFISYQPDYEEMAKIAISLALLPRAIEAIQTVHLLNGYARHIADAMAEDREQSSHVRIITFNYEETTEFLLATILLSRCRDSSVVADNVLKHVQNKIMHVYGKFSANMTYDTESKRFTHPLITKLSQMGPSVGEIEKSVQGIRTMRFSRTQNRGSGNFWIDEAFREADQVVFLGFGYDEVNLRTLGLDQVDIRSKPRRLIGTSIGLTEAAISRVKRSLPSIEMHPKTCSDLLKDHVDFG